MIAEAERRLGLRKWEWARYTLTQLLHALSERSRDPHAGNVPITSLADIARLDAERRRR